MTGVSGSGSGHSNSIGWGSATHGIGGGVTKANSQVEGGRVAQGLESVTIAVQGVMTCKGMNGKLLAGFLYTC
jgi:hypothetical protein